MSPVTHFNLHVSCIIDSKQRVIEVKQEDNEEDL